MENWEICVAIIFSRNLDLYDSLEDLLDFGITKMVASFYYGWKKLVLIQAFKILFRSLN